MQSPAHSHKPGLSSCSQNMGTLLGALSNFAPKTLTSSRVFFQGLVSSPWYRWECSVYFSLNPKDVLNSSHGISQHYSSFHGKSQMRMKTVLGQLALMKTCITRLLFCPPAFISPGSANAVTLRQCGLQWVWAHPSCKGEHVGQWERCTPSWR